MTAERAWRSAFVALALLLPAVIAYSNALHGGFVFDDSRIYYSRVMRIDSLAPSGLARVVTRAEPRNRPVANLSFALNYYFNGYDTFGYHLVNLLLHIGCGIIIFFLFRLTLDLARADPDSSEWLALAAAVVWLVHPLNSQAVDYIVQRMAVLAAFFSLAAALCYARGRLARDRGAAILNYAAALALWLLALGSKENSAVLPLALFFYEWIFFQEGRTQWLVRAAPVLLGIAVILAGCFFLFTGFAPLAYVEKGFAGRPFGLAERLLTEPRVLVFYLGLFFWPLPSRLSLEHDFPISHSLLDPPSTAVALLLLAGLVVAAWFLRARKPVLSFGITWFLVGHLVEGTVIPLELVFEHRNYLADVFLCLAVVELAWTIIRPWWLRPVTGLAVIVALVFFTHARNPAWQGPLTIWRDAAAKAPGSARAHNNLGVALKRRGRLAAAAREYQAALRIDPKFTEAYVNLGNVLGMAGRHRDAARCYRAALRVAPRLAVARHYLGREYMKMGRLAAARREIEGALALRPGDAEMLSDLRYIAALARVTGSGGHR